jgi:hypothetical protein
MSSEIVTYTGRVVDPLDLKPEQVNIVDIAHSLSNQCRFTGHVKSFYSVGEHSVRCAEFVIRHGGTKREALALLLHDGSETYCADLARPVKHAKGLGEAYRAVEDAIQAVISERFGLEYPFPQHVHNVDNALLLREQQDLMPRFRHIDSDLVYDQEIIPWPSGAAEQPFLDMYEHLTGEKPRR